MACISKLYLDRHHQSKLKLNLCLSNFCQQNIQNIVTWGVELQSRNTIFACISMESLISGVLPFLRFRYYACSELKTNSAFKSVEGTLVSLYFTSLQTKNVKHLRRTQGDSTSRGFESMMKTSRERI